MGNVLCTDYVQEAWVTCLENFQDTKGKWEHYLNRTIAKERKKEMCEDKFVELDFDVQIDACQEEKVLQRERAQILSKALKQLNKNDLKLIIECVIEDEPLKMFGDPSNTLKRFRKILNDLKKFLEFQGYRKEDLL